MKDIVVLVRIWLVRIGFLAGCLLPLRARVVLATSHADRIDGNLAAIADGLLRWAPQVEVQELAHRSSGGVLGRLSGAIRGIAAGYALARTRVFVVDDYFFPIYPVRPRRGTRIVQVWHASGAFKRFGYSLAGKTFGADDALLRHVRIHSNYDVCLVSSASVAPAYAEAFGLPIHTEERIIEPTNRFEGKRMDRRTLMNPKHWHLMRDPSTPSWGEPFTDIAARMLAAMRDAHERTDSGEVVMVSHQLPIWTVHRAVAGKRLAHDPRKRRCSLSSVTSFAWRDGAFTEIGYQDPAADLLENAIDLGAV